MRTKKLFIVLLALSGVTISKAAAKIPPELVGEWAAAGTRFANPDLIITKGVDLLLSADGFAVYVVAPPPMGSPGSATYDSKAHKLKIVLREGGEIVWTFSCLYDEKKKTLTTIPQFDPKTKEPLLGQVVLTRRFNQIRPQVLKSFRKK